MFRGDGHKRLLVRRLPERSDQPIRGLVWGKGEEGSNVSRRHLRWTWKKISFTVVPPPAVLFSLFLFCPFRGRLSCSTFVVHLWPYFLIYCFFFGWAGWLERLRLAVSDEEAGRRWNATMDTDWWHLGRRFADLGRTCRGPTRGGGADAVATPSRRCWPLGRRRRRLPRPPSAGLPWTGLRLWRFDFQLVSFWYWFFKKHMVILHVAPFCSINIAMVQNNGNKIFSIDGIMEKKKLLKPVLLFFFFLVFFTLIF